MRLRVNVGESGFCCHTPWLYVWCLSISVNSFCFIYLLAILKCEWLDLFYLFIFYWSKAVRPDWGGDLFEQVERCVLRQVQKSSLIETVLAPAGDTLERKQRVDIKTPYSHFGCCRKCDSSKLAWSFSVSARLLPLTHGSGINWQFSLTNLTEFRSCVKVQVANLGFPFWRPLWFLWT